MSVYVFFTNITLFHILVKQSDTITRFVFVQYAMNSNTAGAEHSTSRAPVSLQTN